MAGTAMSIQAAPQITSKDWLLIGALAVLWGLAFFFNAVGLRAMGPNTLVFLRMALATAPLLVFVRIRRLAMPTSFAAWRGLALLGLLNVVIPFVLFTWAQTRISSGLASVLNATTPLWGVIVAHFLTADEKATPQRIMGVLLGFAGVTTMLVPDLRAGLSGGLLPQLACLAATLSYALASIVGLRLNLGGMTPVTLATGQVASSAMMMVPVMLLSESPWTLPLPSAGPTLAVLGLALLSTSLAYLLYFRVLESAGASNSLLITFLIPVVAIFLGVVFLGESITPWQLGGIGLIALGLVALDGRLLQKAD